ncbi:UNVERIFIED_CONTAM: hypothetical protein FKN15_075587 [Acipenser sinensis]
MVESTSRNCASPSTPAPSKEARGAVLLDTLGAPAGQCQEDCTSSRKSRNTGKGWGVKACASLNTERRCSGAAFQGTWRWRRGEDGAPNAAEGSAELAEEAAQLSYVSILHRVRGWDADRAECLIS